MVNTDHHGRTGACWPCRAVFAPPQIPRSKTRRPQRTAVRWGRHVWRKSSIRIEKNLCTERAGVSHAERVGRLVVTPMGTRMQSSDVVAPLLINKGQFHNQIHESPAGRGHSLRYRTSNRAMHRSTCRPGPMPADHAVPGRGRRTHRKAPRQAAMGQARTPTGPAPQWRPRTLMGTSISFSVTTTPSPMALSYSLQQMLARCAGCTEAGTVVENSTVAGVRDVPGRIA